MAEPRKGASASQHDTPDWTYGCPVCNALPDEACVTPSGLPRNDHARRLRHIALARVLLERAQDGYVNPTGGKTTGRERKDG